jgi:hypothetical protein
MLLIKEFCKQFCWDLKFQTTFRSLAAPIPVPEMEIMALERLVELTKDNNPVGHCYSKYSIVLFAGHHVYGEL